MRQEGNALEVRLSPEDRTHLRAAVDEEHRRRVGRRYQSILLVADEESPSAVAAILQCSLTSVYNWIAAWRRAGLAGLAEKPHPGKTPALDASGEEVLVTLLKSRPHQRGYDAGGWTVALLQRELGRAGYSARDRTIRRALHRLGWRWESNRSWSPHSNFQ